jgi:CRP-like cAMP-binding protein
MFMRDAAFLCLSWYYDDRVGANKPCLQRQVRICFSRWQLELEHITDIQIDLVIYGIEVNSMVSIDQIRNYPLFEGLSEADLKTLAACTVKRSFAKNAYIFHPGNPALNLYLVESGMVRNFFCDSRGNEFLLNLMKPHSVIGHPLKMKQQIRLLGAAAQLPTVVLSISHEDIFRVMGSSRQFSMNIYMDLASLMRNLLIHYQSFLTLGLEGRTAALLLHLVEGDSDTIYLPVSQTTFASWLGVSRGRLNRTFIKFQKRGLISLDGTKVYILDRQGLVRITEELPDNNL